MGSGPENCKVLPYHEFHASNERERENEILREQSMGIRKNNKSAPLAALSQVEIDWSSCLIPSFFLVCACVQGRETKKS